MAAELPSSTLFDEVSFYKSFERDINASKHEITIESPFLTVYRTESLLNKLKKANKRGVKVRVNTRNPNSHDTDMRIQAWQSINMLRSVGVKVSWYNDMRHRKLAVIDRTVVWEGSLNILSQCRSKEIMRRTSSETQAQQILRFTGMNRWSW